MSAVCGMSNSQDDPGVHTEMGQDDPGVHTEMGEIDNGFEIMTRNDVAVTQTRRRHNKNKSAPLRDKKTVKTSAPLRDKKTVKTSAPLRDKKTVKTSAPLPDKKTVKTREEKRKKCAIENIEEFLVEVEEIANGLEDNEKTVKASKVAGGVGMVAGSSMLVAGLMLAPATAGISMAVAGFSIFGTAGTISGGTFLANKLLASQKTKKLKELVEKIAKEMSVICSEFKDANLADRIAEKQDSGFKEMSQGKQLSRKQAIKMATDITSKFFSFSKLKELVSAEQTFETKSEILNWVKKIRSKLAELEAALF